MTGKTFDGGLDLRMKGHAWKKSQTPPLYLNLLDRGGHWLALPTDQSGGLRGGDKQTNRIMLSEGASLRWFPPSSALYHPGADRSLVCTLDNDLRVDAGCSLCFCPKAAIPCAGARVSQTTRIELETGADFLFWDSWTNGRTAGGEEWEFLRLENELVLSRDGKKLFQERWKVEGAVGRGPAELQGNRMWVLGLAQGEWATLQLRETMERMKASGGRGEVGVLADGVCVARFLSPRVMDFFAFPVN